MAYNFTQSNNNQTANANKTATVPIGSLAVLGDVSVVFVMWNNNTSTCTVADNANGAYTQAGSYVRLTDCTTACFYRANIAASAANTNTITATFNVNTPGVDMFQVEYTGPGTTVSVENSTTGTGTTSPGVSSAITTKTTDDLSIFAGYTDGAFSGTVGGSWSSQGTTPYGSVLAVQETTSAVSISANATMSSAATYTILLVEFKMATAVTTLRPMPPAGTLSVSGAVAPKYTPLRPMPPAGSIVVAGVIAPHLLLRPALTPGQIASWGTVIPRFNPLRPMPPAGTVALSGQANPQLLSTHVLRPGPVALAFSVSGRVIVRIPILPQPPHGFVNVTGRVTPHFLLRPGSPTQISGQVSASGLVKPPLQILRPSAKGTIALSAKVTPELPQSILLPGPISGFIGVVGVVHGSIGPPNRILVQGTVNPELVIRPAPRGFIISSGVAIPRNIGTLRPQAFGAMGVAGVAIPKFNPLRPLPPAGALTLSGTSAPKYLGGPPLEITDLPPGFISVSGVVIPSFSFRPGAQGAFSLIGGSTTHHLVLSPAPPAGALGVTGAITPRLLVYPGAKGTFSFSGKVTPQQTGVLRPQAFGSIGLTAILIPEYNPNRPGASGTWSVYGFATPRFKSLGPPVVEVTQSGYYVVRDVANAVLVMYMLAQVDYGGFAVAYVEAGPFSDYQTALAQLMDLQAIL